MSIWLGLAFSKKVVSSASTSGIREDLHSRPIERIQVEVKASKGLICVSAVGRRPRRSFITSGICLRLGGPNTGSAIEV